MLGLRIKHLYQPAQTHLTVVLCGKCATFETRWHLERIRNQAAKLGLTRLLIDLRRIFPPETRVTQLLTGQYWARAFRFPYKTAVLVSQNVYGAYAPTFAQIHGAQLELFTEQDQALEWLLSTVREVRTLH